MEYGYCRVSTRGQLDGNSIEEQQKMILERYPNAKIVIESKSGAKERPIFLELISTLQEGDVLVVTKLDRFCRTAKEGLGYADSLIDKGVSVHILNMGLMDNSPISRVLTTCLLAFAEFERNQIIDRTTAGKAIARQNPNYREGRPRKYNATKVQHALELLETHSYKQVEEMTGISKSTLQRRRREQCKL